jgi:hypothetical protein
LKTVVNVPNDFLILEENDGIIVTDFPSKLSQVTTENPSQPKPLNQGSTLLLFLLSALLFCACLTASTLAFVSSFHNERTLEKKSRFSLKFPMNFNS